MSRKTHEEILAHLATLPDPVIDDENPEWTEEMFRNGMKAEDMPPEMLAFFPRTVEAIARRRGAQKTAVKKAVSIRLDQDVIAHFQKTGRGWQSRINETLRKTIR